MKIYKRKLLIKILASVSALSLICSASAFADVLGTATSHTEQEFAQGTKYVKNTFYNDDVGQQTENFFEYTSNTDVLPIVANGASIYGKRTLTQAENILSSSGVNTAMGMNADFFSFQTGVPMSNTIIGGNILSKDSSWLPSLGFNADGTGFIGTMAIQTTIWKADGQHAEVECINKYRQPYSVYLYTDDFAQTTHGDGWGIDVILTSVSGDMKIGNDVTAVVESITENDGSVIIPEGKMVLSVSASASNELKNRLYMLTPGETITIANREISGDGRWQYASHAIGCTGGTLLTGGQLNYKDESAAPRSAVGIKADGKIVFYTIDGRQQGYSYGVRKETLARRLLEMGCTDAVNLDGGGSTSIGGTFPGTEGFQILNSPSEGTLRSCANFIFLQKMQPKTGVPSILYLSNYSDYVLSGSATQISVTQAIDKSYGPAQITGPIVFGMEADNAGGQSSVTQDGIFTAGGEGEVYINAVSGEAYGCTMLKVTNTVTSMQVQNSGTGDFITSLTLRPGESIDLTPTAYYNNNKILTKTSDFAFGAVSNSKSIGAFSGSQFTASQNIGASGKISVTAGGYNYEIPVNIASGSDNNTSNYPSITDLDSTNGFSVSFAPARSEINRNGITLKVDGTNASFSYDENTRTLTYEYPDEFLNSAHRIGVYVTDNLGYTSMKYYTVGNEYGLSNNGRFSDTDGHWAESYIEYAAMEEIVKGSENERGGYDFRPQSSMTRAEFAVMLCNYLNVDASSYSGISLPFADSTDIPFWALNQIKAVYSLGIMQGQLTENGTIFNPYSNIKRLEFAIAAERLLPDGLRGSAITAADSADIPWWAQTSLEIIFTQGIMTGYPDGTILPNNPVTRAEAVKILFNIM